MTDTMLTTSMASTVSFISDKIEILKTQPTFQITLKRLGDLSRSASVNVLLRGSDLYPPSAGQYDGIKLNFFWNPGDGANKTVSQLIIPSPEPISYLDVELVDFFQSTAGEFGEASIAIHDAGIIPGWVPSAKGDYYQVIKVNELGKYRVVTEPVVTIPVMKPPAGGLDGEAGIVPAPKVGDENKFFRGDGTYSLPPEYLKSINGIQNPAGDIELVGKNGLEIIPNSATKEIEVSLPVGEDGDVLVWDEVTKTYIPGMVDTFTYSTATLPGDPGIVPTPPPGVNYYLSAQGWQVIGSIPGVNEGGTNGKIVRISSSSNGVQTWVDASNLDSVNELYAAGLAFKFENIYYYPGSLIQNFPGLITGEVYYLDDQGMLTLVAPEPTPTVKRVAIGKALSPNLFSFFPGIVITG